MNSGPLERWTVRDAAELYGIHEWSAGYFDISDKGEVVVRPKGNGSNAVISLTDIVEGLKERGLNMPVLLRFSDILESRLTLINESFRKAMRDANYQGVYRGVYPVKVNQQQHVIEEIATFGRRYHHGLEVGSKAELITALAHMDDPEAYLVCNGYKDEEFVKLALCALKMGIRTVFVIEMNSELPIILDCAERLNVTPCLGVRVKLSSRGAGRWEASGGDRSKFGLFASECMEGISFPRLRFNCPPEITYFELSSEQPQP